MFKNLMIVSLILMTTLSTSSERRIIVPANGAKPVGPYSPGLLVDDYLYASGQGVRDGKGVVPEGLAAQTRQCLENVKAIVEAAGLTMAHVVHMQLYLEKISDLPEVDRVYQEYFPTQPPARVIIGTAKMPTDTNVEMTVVAVRDLKQKKALSLKSLPPIGHASSAIEAGNRVYFSGSYGKTQADAEDGLKKARAEAGVAQIVFHNDYGTSASAMIPMHDLPNGMAVAISAIGLLKADKGVADGCATDGKTIFCQAQVAANRKDLNLVDEVDQVFKQLQAKLEKHGATLAHTVATNVYLDDINEFKVMNEKYATFFSSTPPTRTTVQPFAKSDRAAAPAPLVKISLVAVKD